MIFTYPSVDPEDGSRLYPLAAFFCEIRQRAHTDGAEVGRLVRASYFRMLLLKSLCTSAFAGNLMQIPTRRYQISHRSVFPRNGDLSVRNEELRNWKRGHFARSKPPWRKPRSRKEAKIDRIVRVDSPPAVYHNILFS